MMPLMMMMLITMAMTMTPTMAVDETLQERATGADVVDTVVSLIKDSCVMPQDNLLLRRLAYVESQDGLKNDTFRSGFYGGIWQVTQQMYDQTKTSSSPAVQTMRDNIQAHLNIYWNQTTWQDLLKPLHSGLAAALYIAHSLQGQPTPVGITDQQTFWFSDYNQNSLPSNAYSSLATLLDKGCEGQPQVDLAFAIDTSSSISPQDFEDAKDFIINITEGLDMNNGHSRVALITFASSATTRVSWGQHQSHSALRQTIGGLTYQSGNTETAQALDLARNMFVTAGRRGAVKVLVLVTDGKSHDNIDTATAAAALATDVPGILVLVVGVGNLVDQDELYTIATTPPCKHTFQVDRYDQIEALKEEILRITCTAPVTLHVNETGQCDLARCPIYMAQVPPGKAVLLEVRTNCSTLHWMYGDWPTLNNRDIAAELNRDSSGPSQPFAVNTPRNSGTSSLYYYVTFDKTVPENCWYRVTSLLDEVQIVCTKSGRSRACRPQDLDEYRLNTGINLCTP